MIIKVKEILLCSVAIPILLFTLSSLSHAVSCPQKWLFPSFQSMETEIMDVSLREYANGERHLLFKQGKTALDIYYLRGALIVKGLDDAEMDFGDIRNSWLPMIFMSSTGVISEAFPQGPCSIKQKTTFSIPDAEGDIVPVSRDIFNFQFTAKGKKSMVEEKSHCRGTIQFTPPLAAPDEDSNVTGYRLVGPTKPYPVIGSPNLPVKTIGALRRLLIEKNAQPKKWEGPKPEIVMAPDEKVDAEMRKEIYPFYIRDRNYCFVDKKGHVVVETPCLIMKDFQEDIAICSTILKGGYINREGKVIVAPQYGLGEYANFSEGLAAVKIGKKWGFIDKTGKLVIEPMFSVEFFPGVVPSFSEGLTALQNDTGGWGFIDKTGNYVIEPQFGGRACNFHEGLAAVRSAGKNGKWGFINKNGEFVIEPKFETNYYRSQLDLYIDKPEDPTCPNFSEGLAAMRHGGAWGFIDRTGHFVIEPKFEHVRDFHNGFASAKMKGPGHRHVIIDKTGKHMTKEYNYVSGFNDGMAKIDIYNGKEHLTGYLDNKGRVIVEPIFGQKSQHYSEGLAAVSKNGKFGYIDKMGQFVIEPQFERAEPFKNGVARVSKGSHSGLIDKSGQIFVINDQACGHTVVKNGKGEITWPKNIEALCGQ